MKKTYIKPAMDVQAVASAQMLASSREVTITVSEDEYNGEGRVKSEWTNIWDDDWSAK